MRRKRDRDRGGRPSKFTTPAALAIVAAVGDGKSFDEAARSAGVGSTTLYRWLALGRAGDRRFADLAGAIGQARAGEVYSRMVAAFGLKLLKRGY